MKKINCAFDVICHIGQKYKIIHSVSARALTVTVSVFTVLNDSKPKRRGARVIRPFMMAVIERPLIVQINW